MSKLYLYTNVELDPNYNYTIDFDTKEMQENYFIDKLASVVINSEEEQDYSFIREQQAVKVAMNIDDLENVNYLSFVNNGRVYYAFVLEKEYRAEDVTALTFQIDVMQTFMFEYSIDESFVEREHQDRYKTDTDDLSKLVPIYNLETENIEKGQTYIKTNRVKIDDNIPDDFTLAKDTGGFELFWATIITKGNIGKKSWSALGNLITGSQPSEKQTSSVKGMPTNVFTYIAPVCIFKGLWLNMPVIRCVSKTGIQNENLMVNPLTEKQLMNLTQDPLVISINLDRYCPFGYGCDKDTEKLSTYTATRYKLYPLPSYDYNDVYLTCYEYDNTAQKGSGAMFFIREIDTRSYPVLNLQHNTLILNDRLNIDNFKNVELEPKLNTNEFSYYEIELGKDKLKLNKEDLPKEIAQIMYVNAFSIKNGRAVIPLNYKGQQENTNEMITFDNSTNELPLRTDAWLNYLSQNKSSMISGFVTGTVQTLAGIGLGLVTGGMGLAVAGGQALNFAGGITNNLAQINDIKNRPDEVKKTALDIVLEYVTKDLYLTFNTYDIRPQFKQRAFNYFYHFGYKCNDFKKPNIKSRYYFNYIKTIGANIKTNIDANYKNEIQRILDTGLIFWHYRDPNTFKGVNNFDYENVEMNLIKGENNEQTG